MCACVLLHACPISDSPEGTCRFWWRVFTALYEIRESFFGWSLWTDAVELGGRNGAVKDHQTEENLTKYKQSQAIKAQTYVGILTVAIIATFSSR